jgi:hypothetical protein
MPKGDRTGPEGQGPKTGRKLGHCSGSDEPESVPGRGEGRGTGRGRRMNGEPGSGQGRNRA